MHSHLLHQLCVGVCSHWGGEQHTHSKHCNKHTQVPEVPLVLDDAAEGMTKTSKAVEVLKKIGAAADVEKCKDSKAIRRGKGECWESRAAHTTHKSKSSTHTCTHAWCKHASTCKHVCKHTHTRTQQARMHTHTHTRASMHSHTDARTSLHLYTLITHTSTQVR